MIISEIKDNQITCKWFDKQTLKKDIFSINELTTKDPREDLATGF